MERPRWVTPEEMRGLLRDAFAHDPEKSLLESLIHRMTVPASLPRAGLPGGKLSRRLHPLWLTFALWAVVVLAIFLVFTFARF
jgi:hypothetical protein